MLVAPRTLLLAVAAVIVVMTFALMGAQRNASAARAEAALQAQPATVAGSGFVLSASAGGGAVCLDYVATAGGSYGSCILRPSQEHPVTSALSRDPRPGGRMHLYGAVVAEATSVEIVTSAGAQRLRTHALPALPGMRVYAASPLVSGTVTRVTPLDASGTPLS